MQININGKFYSKQDAKISVFDHGFLYGDGVYETLRTYNGSIFKLDEHINRLLKSADEIEFRLPWSKEYLMKQVHETVNANKFKESRIRITLTRGEGNIGFHGNLKPNFVIVVEDLKVPEPELYVKGVKIITVDIKRVFPTAKTCNSIPSILARQKAERYNAYEAIHCDNNNVKEGTTTNIFIVKSDKLITTKEDMLKGITREITLKLAKNLFNVEERNITKQDLYSARECFLTGTTREILPVTKVDNVIISSGKVGDITKKLMEEFKRYISENT